MQPQKLKFLENWASVDTSPVHRIPDVTRPIVSLSHFQLPVFLQTRAAEIRAPVSSGVEVAFAVGRRPAAVVAALRRRPASRGQTVSVKGSAGTPAVAATAAVGHLGGAHSGHVSAVSA